jgi:hypothetical protein
MTRRRGRLAAGLLVVLAMPAQSWAQTQAPQPPRTPWELAVGGVMITPLSLGTVDANLQDGSGNPVTLFRARNDAGLGFGLEANIGAPVSPRVDVEFSGGWSRFDVRSAISDDFEDVPDVTLTETLTRFSVEGAVLYRFAGSGRTAWFVRGGGGWLRELSSDAALASDGLLVNAGVGVKYWARTNAAGQGRFGIRAEFRVLTRTGGIDIDDRSFRMWPVAAGSVVFKF